MVPSQPTPTATVTEPVTKTEPVTYPEEPDTSYQPLPFENGAGRREQATNNHNEERSWDQGRVQHDDGEIQMSSEPFGMKEDG